MLADEDGATTGNNEWEYYTSLTENVLLQRNGTGGSQLVLQAHCLKATTGTVTLQAKSIPSRCSDPMVSLM